jgi:hypothetical protein
MHLIATSLCVLIDCAMNTSEKVPSPFLAYNRYWSINIIKLNHIHHPIPERTSLPALIIIVINHEQSVKHATPPLPPPVPFAYNNKVTHSV